MCVIIGHKDKQNCIFFIRINIQNWIFIQRAQDISHVNGNPSDEEFCLIDFHWQKIPLHEFYTLFKLDMEVYIIDQKKLFQWL